MTRQRLAIAALVVAATANVLAAQVPPPAPAPAPASPPAPTAPLPPEGPQAVPAPDPFPDDFDLDIRDAVRIGQDFSLAAGDAVRDAVVIFGDAAIAGRVDGDLVVILGTARLASSAIVEGDFVAVGGGVSVESGARVARDMVVVGGQLDAPAGFVPGGEHVVVGSGLVGDWVQGLVPYIARGLVWGRLIVPELPWVWAVVAFFFLVYLAMNLLFDRPVRACATMLRMKPLTAFGVGLLVLLLVGPVSLLLAVSVIGLAIVPFLFCALVAAWLIGKVAVARWIGLSVIPEEEDNRAHSARSFVIGFVLIMIAYMIPIIGLVTWAIVGVLGLGAASLAFVSAYRRENPKPVAPASDVPPPPVPVPYAPPSTATPAEAPTPMAYQAVAPDDGRAQAAGAAAAALPLPATSGVLATMPRALFRDRLAAFVLDVLLVAIAVNILDVDGEDVFLPFLLAYHIGFWTWKQTTVGGIICQLRVVRVDGAPLTFADALVRGLSSIFSLAVFLIGVLWILRDPESQSWHDKIAGTYVVKVPRNWPL